MRPSDPDEGKTRFIHEGEEDKWTQARHIREGIIRHTWWKRLDRKWGIDT